MGGEEIEFIIIVYSRSEGGEWNAPLFMADSHTDEILFGEPRIYTKNGKAVKNDSRAGSDYSLNLDEVEQLNESRLNRLTQLETQRTFGGSGDSDILASFMNKGKDVFVKDGIITSPSVFKPMH